MTTVQSIIEDAYTKVNGEYEPVAPGSDDFRTYLNVLNQAMQTWAHTPYVKWQSLYNYDFVLGDSVSANTLIYPIDDLSDVQLGNSPFDHVYFINTQGEVVAKYKMTNQAMFDATDATDVCALFGDGLHLKATPAEILNTEIRLPMYTLPPKYTTATQNVVIDSVPWLITTMAAFICDASPVPFIARNADKFQKQADILMKSMKDNNNKRQHLAIKGTQDRSKHTWSDVLQNMTVKDL